VGKVTRFEAVMKQQNAAWLLLLLQDKSVALAVDQVGQGETIVMMYREGVLCACVKPELHLVVPGETQRHPASWLLEEAK
jgi:hypothetical protein